MIFREYRYLVRSDLYRMAGRAAAAAFLTQITRGIAFKYVFWLRDGSCKL